MREPAFWWRDAGWQAGLLAPFAAAYGAVAGHRMRQRGHALDIPVICIGNLTVGGAGKTPTALAVAHILIAARRRVFFLTRGYGGRLGGPVRVDASRHSAADVGDEALLLARLAPTIVAEDRVAGGEMAQASGASVIVMDDGYQNPSLIKNLSILVIDGRRGIGNGRVIPAGPLRAGLREQLGFADALLVIGNPSLSAIRVIDAARRRGLPIFRGRVEAEADAVSAIGGRRVLAFAGIGDPQKFFTTLTENGIPVSLAQSFPDHHRFSREEADALVARASAEDLLLVTTEKDLARIAHDDQAVALAKLTRALPVVVEVEEEDALRELLQKTAR